jgi:uncharacterized protein (DUF427 family)
MLKPGPDHPITLEAASHRWRARFNSHVFADTDDAVILHEAHLRPVIYFPRADVATEYMARTDHHTHCPYKGDASYYTLAMDGEILENVAWSYDDPFEAVGEIAGMIAFYADRVDIYEVTDPRIQSRHSHSVVALRERDEIGDAIRHTDAGDGTSQREHWPPNVEVPGPREGGAR